MHVVTAGTAFIDIDAYGSAVALAELLRLQGEDAVAASSAPMNASIPPSLRSLDVQFEADYTPSPDDTFSIVDLSDPEFFDFGAGEDRVVGVIDHHLGFTDYWRERLGDQAHIEFIGSACTQVYELWKQDGRLDDLSPNTAKLLACGILDNTLNLRAAITTERDKLAYSDLATRAGLPDNWPAMYFNECQDFIMSDLENALVSDAKTVVYPEPQGETYVGQLALWDAQEFIHAERSTIREVLSRKQLPWFMNLIDIHSGRSVFYCEEQHTRDWIAGVLKAKFHGEVAIANRMWLRKEIFKQASELAGSPVN